MCLIFIVVQLRAEFKAEAKRAASSQLFAGNTLRNDKGLVVVL